MDKNINELFSLPVGLEVEAVIGGIKLYSSKKLKKSFLLSFEKSGRGRPIHKSVKKLVNKGIINPCYKSKNVLRLLVHKTFGAEQKTILGFYHMPTRRIYVLIDNNINIFGSASNDLLVSTTMHESMHLLAGRKRRKFLSIFMPILIKFYSNFFKEVFQLKRNPNKKGVEKIIKFLSRFENANSRQINKELTKYHKILEKEFLSSTRLDEDKFKRTLIDYIVVTKVYLSSFAVFTRIYKKYTHIFGPLHKTYPKTFGLSNKYTTEFQELINPSEIICVFSEMKSTNSKIRRAFKAI
ncbi:MAG: hypothetical protein PVG65_02000 [Candidatus Thorarchaeota archaeon]|jgi:hypothetical protein